MITFVLVEKIIETEIYMVVDNDQSTTHFIFSGGVAQVVEKMHQLKKAMPFAIFKWTDGQEIDVKLDD